jgi:peptide/nickel transport system substrate-binding protein
VDVVLGLQPDDRQIVRLHPDLTLLRVLGNNVSYVAMNTQKSPFDEVRVRQAVNYAINKRAIVKYAYQGLAQPANGPIPPEMWGYNAHVKHYDYNPALARRLLAEARFSASTPLRFYVMSTPRPYLPNPVLVARMIARDLSEVGIKVELVVRPFAQHVRATQLGEHDLCLAGWAGDTGDPDNFLYLLLDRDNARRGAARNLAMFSHEGLHRLLVQAQAEIGRKTRQELYGQAQAIVAEEAPWVPLAHTNVVVAARQIVRNLRVHPSTVIYYRKVIK